MLMAWKHKQHVVLGSAFVDIVCMSTERFGLFSLICVLLLGTGLRKHGLRKTCWNTCTVVYSIEDV
jgi:hypothetical protein